MPLRSGMLLNISSHAAGEDHGPVGIMAVIGIGCKHTSLSRANDASEIWHALKTQDRMLQMRIMAVIGIGCKSVRFLMQMMTQDRMLQMRIMARRGAVTCFPVGGTCFRQEAHHSWTGSIRNRSWQHPAASQGTCGCHQPTLYPTRWVAVHNERVLHCKQYIDPMRTNLSCCLGLVDNGRRKSTERRLFLCAT